MTRGAHRGFTLIEMVVMIVILGIASAVVVKMVSQVARGGSDNSTLQVGSALLQECAEWVVANHRRDKSFYDSVLVVGTSTNCFSGPSAFGSFNQPTVTISDVSSDPTLCPTLTPAASCKKAVFSISSSDGTTLNTINLIVVKYNTT